MRRAVLAVASTVVALVLLLSFRTHPIVTASAAGGDTEAADRTTVKAGRVTSRTVTGPTVATRWGPVQVSVTMSGERLTKVTVLKSPSGNPRDTEINDYALPVLTREALAAQSGDIDAVSGATVTSAGYISSLQSALDRAGA